MGWYVNVDGQTLGPVDEPKVVAWIQGGQFLRGSICAVGSKEWTDLAAHPVFADALRKAAPPPPHPAVSVPRMAEPPAGSPAAMAAHVAHPAAHPMAPAIGPGSRKPGRWLLLGALWLVMLRLSAEGGVGLLVGAGLLSWGIFGYKRSRLTVVELFVGRRQPRRWAAALTIGSGALFAFIGFGGILAQRDEASRKEQAAVTAEAQRKQRQASLLAAAPANTKAWRATLTSISAGMASVKTGEDLRRKLAEITALRDESQAWLGLLETKPADAAAMEAEIESTFKQIQAMTDFVDGVAALDKELQGAKALIAKRSWLEADQALDGALQRVANLRAADPSFRVFVIGGFDPDRKKADVAALKASIAGAVARAKRQQAAAEAEEKKRAAAEAEQKAAADAYLALCGEAPVVSSWDGELIGLTSTIKETANDPDSIDVSRCTQPILTKDNCWVSTCNVRGKNGFGGLILLRQTWSYSKVVGFSQIK